jgi:aryl-alcohol dehydrogenase-like predicted oxidoreductase
MELRQLGDSDLHVSEISLGSWLTYSGGVGREQADACTRAAFDAGINFFDTANVYGRGASEEVWGEILPDYPRDSYILATKLFWPMADDHHGGLSAAEITIQLDASLKRLKTEYLDLYQCHRFDTRTPIEETMEGLSEAVRSGKVRYIGFSEWTPEQIQAALDVPGTEKLVSSQPQYNAIWRSPEAEVFPLSAANGIGQIVWSPLAQGVLTGKYKPGQAPPDDSRGAHPEMGESTQRYLTDELLEAVARLEPIAEGAGLTMAELALAWVLRRDELSSAIIGASRPEQVHANAKASGITLSADTLAAIDEALDGVTVTDYTHSYGGKPGVLHAADVGGG